MEALLSALVGLGLAAASGFRVFLPALVVSLAARTGHLTLSPGFAWLASDPAFIGLGVATGAEILAYYVPWLDNLLDSLATPAAVVAGILLPASVAHGLDPWLRWSLAVLGGGGLAATFQGLTAGGRGLSTLATAGLANPLVATVELFASALLAVLAVLLPVVAVVVVAVLLVAAIRLWRSWRPRPEAG